MGKHASQKTRGSVLDLFSRTKKAGRHSQPKKSRKLSAATVLESGRRAPVMAAIAVPTVAIVAVAVAGVVAAPQGGDTSAEAFTKPETLAVEQPQSGSSEHEKDFKTAEDQSKDVASHGQVSLAMPQPEEDEPVASSSSSSQSSGSKQKGSSKKGSSKKGPSSSSGSSDADAGDASGDYSSPMSTAEIKAMLGGPGSRWYKIVKCESTFNPRAINKSNRAHFGLFQFKLATWRSVGGKGNPIDAHPREQFKRAKMLQAKAGWGQWSCA
ncbi:MAG: transglycosylase family protein [Brevibacterium sp. UMB1308B]|nr:transglycosylase family protein [Brevibacterium sp. UMB1308B]